VGVAVSTHGVDQRLQALDIPSHHVGDVQPAQPVGLLGGRWLPDGVIVGLNAAQNLVLGHLIQNGLHALLI
jgi:hypothetical protein